MTEPTTEAGRALLRAILYRLEHDGEFAPTDDEGILTELILAIEAEARAPLDVEIERLRAAALSAADALDDVVTYDSGREDGASLLPSDEYQKWERAVDALRAAREEPTP